MLLLGSPCQRRAPGLASTWSEGRQLAPAPADVVFNTLFRWRFVLLLLWLGLWPALLASLRWGTASHVVGLAPLSALAGLLFIGLALWCLGGSSRTLVQVAMSVLAGVALMPARDQTALVRSLYVQELRREEGAPYAAAFENKPGINCSGLVRGTLVGVDLRLALRGLDLSLLRDALMLWMNHCSAAAMGAGCDGALTPLLHSASIDTVDESRLEPGDIAVTRDGRHCLAYAGDHTWVQADPDSRRVLRVRTPSRTHWFHAPVTILRWTQLVGSHEGARSAAAGARITQRRSTASHVG